MNFKNLDPPELDDIMRMQAFWPEILAKHGDNAVNSTVGILIDSATGKPFQPKVVEESLVSTLNQIQQNKDRGLQSQAGNANYLEAHANWVIGSYDKSWPQAQSLGGTGALLLAAELIKEISQSRDLLLDSGWSNHSKIFSDFNISTYQRTIDGHPGYNHEIYIQALQNVADNSWVLLQAVAYNSDGHDRTAEQWDQVYELIAQKSLGVIIDSAYFGLAKSFTEDSTAIRKLIKTDIPSLICLSNSKNLGLYQERLGAFYCLNIEQTERAKFQAIINSIVRKTYSSPARLAAESVANFLSDQSKKSDLEDEVNKIRDEVLFTNRKTMIEKLGNEYNWIGDTTGLFVKLKTDGFSTDQLSELNQNGILAMPNSRINLAIEPKSVVRLAEALSNIL